MKWEKWVIILSIALAITLTFLIYFILIAIHIFSTETQLSLNISNKASVFDSQFHDLLQEHTFLLIDVASRSWSSSIALNESYTALEININEIAAQLSTVYGPGKANEFIALWNSKVNYFLNYTVELRNNNTMVNSDFITNMNKYMEDSAIFWSTLNPYLDKATMKQLITIHVQDLKSSIDYWVAGDYPDYFSMLHNAYAQMGTYSDIVAQAIIKQHSQMFL